MLQHAFLLLTGFADLTSSAPYPRFEMIAGGIALALITGIVLVAVSGGPNYNDVNAVMTRA